MVQHQHSLDSVFGALSDPTRRAVLESLSKGSLPVTELAQPHSMSLTGFMKHLRVLEDAGLVGRSKEGRVVQCTLLPEPMHDAVAWLSAYEKFWTERLDSLARYLDQQEDTMPNNPLEERPSLSITRHYNASPEKVWRAWTDPEALKEWFKPDDSFSVPLAETDIRVGGRFRVVMVSPEGEDHEASGVYLEVIPNQKLVYTWVWKETPERESLVTVTFRPSACGTELELTHEQFVDAEDRDSHKEGWSGSLALLERFLGWEMH